MEPLSAIGARVRSFRKHRGLTQVELAGRIGRSAEALSVLERGRSTPSLPVLSRLSEALAVPLRDFFAPAEAPEQSPEEAALYTALLGSARRLRPPDLELAARILTVIAEQRESEVERERGRVRESGGRGSGRGNARGGPRYPPPPAPASDHAAGYLRNTLAMLLRLYKNDRPAIAATLTRRRRFLAEMGDAEDVAFLDALLKKLRQR